MKRETQGWVVIDPMGEVVSTTFSESRQSSWEILTKRNLMIREKLEMLGCKCVPATMTIEAELGESPLVLTIQNDH